MRILIALVVGMIAVGVGASDAGTFADIVLPENVTVEGGAGGGWPSVATTNVPIIRGVASPFVVDTQSNAPLPRAITNKYGGVERIIYGTFEDAHSCAKSITDAQIKELCESGRVCDVIGHRWRTGRLNLLTLESAPAGMVFLYCLVCGKQELRKINGWK